MKITPDASYQSVHDEILNAHENHIYYRMITPRSFEAICMKTVQVMYPGQFSGILEPWKHYIPLERDFSNLNDVISAIKDDDLLQEVAERAYDEIIKPMKYSERNLASGVDGCINFLSSQNLRKKLMHNKLNKLYLFGDSICFGQLVNAPKTWAVKLSLELNKIENVKNSFIVQNAGVNGNTTRQALLRIHYDVISHKPDFLIIQFGMNDCNYWADDICLPRVSPKSFVANLEEMIERGLSSGVKHIFLNTNHPSRKGHISHDNSISYDKSNFLYNQLIRETGNQLLELGKPITLIDMESVFKSHISSNKNVSLESLLLEDGIHLSEQGHGVYNKFLVPLVVEKITGFIG